MPLPAGDEAPEITPPAAGSPPVGPSAAPDASATARTAGRGGLAIAGAKISFIIFGFAQQLILPHLLGVDGYGAISRVFAIVGILNNIVVATSIQGVSRSVAGAKPGSAEAAFGATLRVHVVLAVVLSLAFSLAAATIASAVGAPHVATPLRIVGLVVLLYGVYAPLVGKLNGQRRFLEQAGLDTAYSVLRATTVCGGAFLFIHFHGDGILGAAVGFVAAAAIIAPIALTRTGFGTRAPGGPSARDYLGFLGPLALGQVSLNLLMQTDFMLLSRFAGVAATAQNLGQQASDTLVGVYRGVQLFAFLPYQLLISISFVLFPMLARSHADGDRAAITQYTRTGVRLALIITGLMAGTISALAPHVLRFAFPILISEQGGASLRILALGMGSFAILGILCTTLTSLGRERASAALTAATVAFVAAGCLIAVPSAAFGPEMLLRTAIATASALTLAAIIGVLILRKSAGAFMPVVTLARVLLSAGICIAIGSRMPWMGKLMVLPQAALVGGCYLILLALTRELGKADLAVLQRAFGRKKA